MESRKSNSNGYNFFAAHITFLKLSGLWNEFSSTYYFYYTIFMLSASFVFFATMNIQIITMCYHFDAITEAILFSIGMAQTIFKTFRFVWQFNAVRKVILQIHATLDSFVENEERKMVTEAKSELMVVSYIYCLPIIGVPFAAAAFVMLGNLLSAEENPRTQPFQIWDYIDLSNSVIYYLAIILQVTLALLSLLLNASFDSLFYAISFSLQSQLKVLALRFQRVENPIINGFSSKSILNNNSNSKITRTEFKSRLISCIKLHHRIIRTAEDVDKFFGPSFFVQVLLSSVSGCLSVYCCAKRKITDPQIYTYIMFTYSTLAEIGVLCYCGERVKEMSVKLRESVSLIDFSEIDSRLRKDISFIILRTSKPIELRASKFFTLSFQMLQSILNRSYKYYSVLDASKKP